MQIALISFLLITTFMTLEPVRPYFPPNFSKEALAWVFLNESSGTQLSSSSCPGFRDMVTQKTWLWLLLCPTSCVIFLPSHLLHRWMSQLGFSSPGHLLDLHFHDWISIIHPPLAFLLRFFSLLWFSVTRHHHLCLHLPSFVPDYYKCEDTEFCEVEAASWLAFFPHLFSFLFKWVFFFSSQKLFS